MKIRGQDSWGSGHYDAPRDGGKRSHRGIDIINHVNEAVCAYEAGTVTKIGYPYNQDGSKKAFYRYIEITCTDDTRQRYFYIEPLVQIEQVVSKGDILGSAQDLGIVYPGIVQHVHFEIKKNGRFINPTEYVKNVVI
mgnify:FL=1